MARRATLIAQERARNPTLLLLDAGDTLLSDRPLTQQSQGALIVEAMNLMGYDAMALGQRDLTLGVDVLRQRMAQAQFPILSANVRLAGGDQLFAQPYAVVLLRDWRVGIIGLAGVPAERVSGFTVSDPVEALRQYLPEVTPQADLVVLLSHLGWTQNRLLADLFPEVDLIVGGGSETAPPQEYVSATTGTLLAQAENPTSGHAGRVVGRWQLSLAAGGLLHSAAWQVMPLIPDYPDDPAITLLLERYAAR